METFQAGDKVVCVNTDLSWPIQPAAGSKREDYHKPDGVLRQDVVYHVAAVPSANSGLGLLITGLRVFYLQKEIPWNSSRFRKVDSLKGHVPIKRRKREPEEQRVVVSAV